MCETNRTTPAPESASTNNQLVLARPAWVDAEDWARIRAEADTYFANAVAEVAPTEPCPYAWCVLDDHAEGHDEFHASTVVRLDFDSETDLGWTAHVFEDRGERPRVALDGVVLGQAGERAEMDTVVDAAAVAMLLWATSKPEARAALQGLVDSLA